MHSIQVRAIKPLKVNITDPQDGCYKVSYKPETTGEFNVTIAVSGEAINGSPFQLKVKERDTSAKEMKKGKRVLSGINFTSTCLGTSFPLPVRSLTLVFQHFLHFFLVE